MSTTIYKICSYCRIEQPISSFNKQSCRKDGHSYHCKTCTSKKAADRWMRNIEHNREKSYNYFVEHREERRLYAEHMRKTDPDRTRQYSKKWSIKNPTYTKEYHINNKDRLNARRKQYRINNPERWSNIAKRWRDTNPGRVRSDSVKRIMIRRQSIPPWFEREEVKQIYIESARISRETGILHHVDHIIPLRGEMVCGLHCLGNLRIVPWYENLSKGNKMLTELL